MMRTRQRKGIALAGLLVALMSSASAESLVMYNLNGGSYAATTNHPDISPSNAGTAGDWLISGASGTLYISGAANVPTGAPDLEEYIAFTISPLENKAVWFSGISVDFGGDNDAVATPYAVTIELRSSADNYASILGVDSYTIPVKSASLKPAFFNLSSFSTLQHAAETEFRFYVYDNTDAGTTSTFRVRIDNISAIGSVEWAKKLSLIYFSNP